MSLQVHNNLLMNEFTSEFAALRPGVGDEALVSIVQIVHRCGAHRRVRLPEVAIA